MKECLHRAKENASFTKKIEVEVESLEEMAIAARGGADIIMFDNMSPEMIERGVELLQEMGLREQLILEASGASIPPISLSMPAAVWISYLWEP